MPSSAKATYHVRLAGAIEKASTNRSGRIGIQEKNKVITPDSRRSIEDLDSLPSRRGNSTPYKKYSSLLAKRSPVTTCFTRQGLPVQVPFCDRPRWASVQGPLRRERRDEMEECVGLGIRES